MKKVKHIHSAISAPIDDLVTYRALPTRNVEFIDPFLFLNHHGPQVYPPHNAGLPFGPHPHRGFETLTFILKGDLMHADSDGHESVITAGGIQWMTAGRGIVHSELSSENFKEKGGELEILQLWMNLPAKLKMTSPAYTGLQKKDIPTVTADQGKVILNVISGEWTGTKGPVDSLTGIDMASCFMQAGGKLKLEVKEDRNVFFYVVSGAVEVNGHRATQRQLVEFVPDEGKDILIDAETSSILLLGHGKPYYESVVAQGPFVMNNMAEIRQAFIDYQNGKFEM